VGCDTLNVYWKENELCFREVGSCLQLRWDKWTSSADTILYLVNSTNETNNECTSSLMGLMDILLSLSSQAKALKVFILFNKFDREEGGIGANDAVDMKIAFQQLLQKYHFDHILNEYDNLVEILCISAVTGLNVGNDDGLLDCLVRNETISWFK